MKKTIRCGIAAAVLVAAGFTAFQSYSSYGVQDNSLLMQNVEALASGADAEGDGGGDWSDCPRDKYIRNAKEDWESQKAQYDAGVGVYVMFRGRKVNVGGSVGVGGTVYVPRCADSTGNCCAKSHLDKKFRYA